MRILANVDGGVVAVVIIAFVGLAIVIRLCAGSMDNDRIQEQIEAEGKECLLFPGDIGEENFCIDAVRQTVKHFRNLNIVVNNAGEQHPQEDFQKISRKQLERTVPMKIRTLLIVLFSAMFALPALACGPMPSGGSSGPSLGPTGAARTQADGAGGPCQLRVAASGPSRRRLE